MKDQKTKKKNKVTAAAEVVEFVPDYYTGLRAQNGYVQPGGPAPILNFEAALARKNEGRNDG
jgi:hypothetical protein